MGAMDFLRAAAKEATNRGRAAVEVAVTRAREVEGADRVEGILRGAATLVGEAEQSRRTRNQQLLARAGDSAAGAAVGRHVRAFGRLAGRLPVLSVPTDLLTGRNGVDTLVAAVQEQPDDALAHARLGEAMQAMQADARYLEMARTVRAMFDPTSLVFREAMKTAARLGAPAVDPAAQVFARARHLAASRLRTDARDAAALHALARVELATGRPDLAVTPAKLAVAASGDRGHALVTLARVHFALGADPSAANVARKAVDAGCSLGWQVLAELLYRDVPADDPPRHREYVAMRGRVTDADRRAYHGVHRTSAEITRSVLDTQRERVRALGTAAQARLRSGTPAATGTAAPPQPAILADPADGR